MQLKKGISVPIKPRDESDHVSGGVKSTRMNIVSGIVLIYDDIYPMVCRKLMQHFKRPANYLDIGSIPDEWEEEDARPADRESLGVLQTPRRV